MVHHFIPQTKEERENMLKEIGKSSISELFNQNEDIKLKEKMDIPNGISEYEAKNYLYRLSKMNRSANELSSFAGGGTYNHFIPSAIDSIVSRSEFYTAYTPYQPEISQGTLQMIFEFQTMISSLTGMDFANASVYDGGTACAEAIIVALASNRKKRVLVSKTLNDQYRAVIKTYLKNLDVELVFVDEKDLLTDIDDLKSKINDDVSAVLIPYVNFYGNLENVDKIKELLPKKALYIIQTNPMHLGLLKKPGNFGADIVVGDLQPFGNAMNFGGPHAGFMTCTKKVIRKMPGRVVGETEDRDGKKGYVLTLQAREQHIRREKAISNICSNQGLNVLTTAIYLSLMGPKGIKDISTQCYKKAHYLSDQINSIDGFNVVNNSEFFNEFVVECPVTAKEVNDRLLEKDILAGINLSFLGKENQLLVCATEVNSKDEIDTFISELKGL